MTKQELIVAVEAVKKETKNALQIMYDMLSQEQQEHIIKDESVKALFDRYGVNYKSSEIIIDE